MLPYPLLFRLQVVSLMRNVPALWLKVPLEAERTREVFRLAIVAGHSVIAELSYELQHSKCKRCVCAVGSLVVVDSPS